MASSRLWHVLTACVAALSGPAVATLRAQIITEVHVTPETMTIAVGQEQPLFTTAFDRQGNLVPAARFTFRTSDSSVAAVRGDGTVVGRKPGLAKIEARAGHRRASLAVLVADTTTRRSQPPRATQPSRTTPPPGPPSAPPLAPPGGILALEPAAMTLLPSEKLSAVPRVVRDDGTSVTPPRVTWKSLQPEVATVDGEGRVVALAPGRAAIQATAGAMTATMPVEVVLANFALDAARLALTPGKIDTLRATVPSQGGREVRAALRWYSSDSTVARVGAGGVIEAVAPGTAQVIAAGLSQERRAVVLVYRRPETFILSPPPSKGSVPVPLQGSAELSARAEAADGTPIPAAPIVWELGDSSLIAFDQSTGQVSGKALGATTLTAKLDGFPPAVWTISVQLDTIAK